MRRTLGNSRGSILPLVLVVLVLQLLIMGFLVARLSRDARAGGAGRRHGSLEDIRIFLARNTSCALTMDPGALATACSTGGYLPLVGFPQDDGDSEELIARPSGSSFTRHGLFLLSARCEPCTVGPLCPRGKWLSVRATTASAQSALTDPFTGRMLDGNRPDPAKGVDQGWIDLFPQDTLCIVP